MKFTPYFIGQAFNRASAISADTIFPDARVNDLLEEAIVDLLKKHENKST